MEDDSRKWGREVVDENFNKWLLVVVFCVAGVLYVKENRIKPAQEEEEDDGKGKGSFVRLLCWF